MKDTIRTIVNAIETKTSESLELINKVDSFYNSAWDKLVLVGTVSFGLIGFIVPLIIQWYQKRTLKLSEELLKKEIENQTLKLKNEIVKEVTEGMELKILDYESRVSKFNASANARAFHLQGNLTLNDGGFQSALGDYITSSFNYLKCDDYLNLQTVLTLIADSCIPNLSIEEIDDLKMMTGYDLVALIEELEAKDNNGSLTRIIREIKLKYQKAPKTIQLKPQE